MAGTKRGFMRERAPGVWEMRAYDGVDNRGQSRYRYQTFRGTRREADKALTRLVAATDSSRAQTGQQTVRDALERWYARTSPDWSPKTRTHNRFLIDNYLAPTLGRVAVRRLKTEEVEDAYTSLRTQGNPVAAEPRPLSATTVLHAHRALHAALESVVGRWIDRNPATGADVPKMRKREHTLPSPEALTAAVAHFEAKDPEMALWLRMAAVTGARRGELCAIRWGDVQGDELAIHRSAKVTAEDGHYAWVVADYPKTAASMRRIALDAGTVAGLDRQRREAAARHAHAVRPKAYVFASEIDGSVCWNPERVTQRWTKTRDSLGLAGVRVHDLRHYVATHLLNLGTSPANVAARLGDSASTIMAVYGHAVRASDHEAAERMSDLLGTI